MIVVDASALSEILLQSTRARAIETLLFRPGESLHAPHLLDIEVLHVLRRAAANGWIGETRAIEALADLAAMRVLRHPHGVLAPRIWELRHNLSAYDAAYVALAEALGATFVTCDARLASAPGVRAQVTLV